MRLTREPKRKQQPEYQLQRQVAQWLTLQFPDVMFVSDVKGSVKLRIEQAVRFRAIQKHGFANPDLVIYAMRHGHGAMFLELKAESPYRLDGELRKDKHTQEQFEAIEALRKEGYHADFYWELDTIIERVKWYLRG